MHNEVVYHRHRPVASDCPGTVAGGKFHQVINAESDAV